MIWEIELLVGIFVSLSIDNVARIPTSNVVPGPARAPPGLILLSLLLLTRVSRERVKTKIIYLSNTVHKFRYSPK